MNSTEELEIPDTPPVTRIAEVDLTQAQTLLNRYRLHLNVVDIGQAIPGSFWGDEEAGLIADQLYIRADTPLHSLLHEACHYICMDSKRRSQLHTNAGGTSDEENAVCYLQILLSDHFTQFSKAKMMQDMNSWGYNFMLGSSEAWFKEDAEDARQWLIKHKLINAANQPSYQLRD